MEPELPSSRNQHSGQKTCSPPTPSGFVAGSVVGLQQFGFGLAAAILIDVTIVRALLVPSSMKLFGKWNWWLPQWMAQVVRVEPSPLGQHRPRRDH